MKRHIAAIVTILILMTAIFALPVAAEESVESQAFMTEEGTEAITEDVPVEDLKEVLIILAESETKSEALDRVMQLNPNASAGDALDLVDAFEEMSIFWDCRECILYDLGEGLDYGIEAEWLEWYLDTYFPELPESCEIENAPQIDIGEVSDIINESSSLSEAVIAIAGKFGITIAEAEELVSDIKELGDKYLGDTELWEIIKNDMTVNPEKYIVIALCFLIFVALIVFILRWIISNMGQMRTMKLNLASLKKSVDGDDSEEGKAFSLRSLITAKNDEIKALEEKDSAIESEVIKLREQAERLTQSAEEVLNNSKSALNITQETAIQIAQLLCIAMEKGKMPVLSSEARRIWFENTQANILGVTEGNEDGSKADEDIQEV
jgi:hypothetical protein